MRKIILSLETGASLPILVRALIYESALKGFIIYKNSIFWNVLTSDLADQLYEFLTGKGNIRRKIVKEYSTSVRFEM